MSLLRARHAVGDRLLVEGFPVRLEVNARARHVLVRIDKGAREAVAVAPSVRRLAEAADFARRKAPWISRRLAELPAPIALTPGSAIEVFGRPWPAPAEARLISRALRAEARRVFADRIERHRQALGVAERPRLSIGDTRSRWGSCAKARAGRGASIRLSWRLALAPWPVADYVAAHECAHLVEANHGPRFWALVENLVGDPRPHRLWLRRHGASLHGIL